MDALLLAKASLLLLATLIAARALRRAPAILRHRLWTLAFTSLLALPLLGSALPALYVPVPDGWRAPITVPQLTPVSTAATPTNATFTGDRDGRDTPSESTRTAQGAVAIAKSQHRIGAGSLPLRTLLLAVWGAGTLAAVGALLLSLVRVRRLTRSAELLTDPAWRHAAAAIGARLGLRRSTRLMVSRLVATPMAGGHWRPVVFLPVSARTWSDERRDIVLAHELAHLAGRDPLRHVAARLAVAVYWFHPLALVAARQSAVAREQACDEAVLGLGTRPSAYARVLLDLADTLQGAAPAVAALPMVERSLLEARLMAILNDDIRPAARRRVLPPALGVAVITISLSAAQPALPPLPPLVPLLAAAPAAVAALEAEAPALETPDAAAAAALQSSAPRDSACGSDLSSPFSGSLSMSDSGGRRVIYEQIGTRGADRIIQKTFGDVRLCMVAEGAGPLDKGERPSEWLGRARRVVIESRRGSAGQRLEVTSEGGGSRMSWSVGGKPQPFDSAAEQWRDRVLAALDTTWELSSLRGEVSTLRGEISSRRGDESSLRGEISSLMGEVSSLRGRASSIRGEESSLRGEISSIRGHVSSLRGEISSENGAISSLNASRFDASDAERARIAASVRQHDEAIARLERELQAYDAEKKIAEVERQIKALDADGKVSAVEAEIRAFDLDAKVAEVEARIAALDVGGKTAAIERQIEALDVDRRARQLEDRLAVELRQLHDAIAKVK